MVPLCLFLQSYFSKCSLTSNLYMVSAFYSPFPFHTLLLVYPLSEFISSLDLLKEVQFLVERTLRPSFLSTRLPAIWPSNRKPFSTELLLRNKVESFYLNITRNLELSRSIHSECPRKTIDKALRKRTVSKVYAWNFRSHWVSSVSLCKFDFAFVMRRL